MLKAHCCCVSALHRDHLSIKHCGRDFDLLSFLVVLMFEFVEVELEPWRRSLLMMMFLYINSHLSMKIETSLSSKCLLDICGDVFVCCCLGLNRELRFVLTVETEKSC